MSHRFYYNITNTPYSQTVDPIEPRGIHTHQDTLYTEQRASSTHQATWAPQGGSLKGV